MYTRKGSFPALVLTALLSACGGSGSGSSPVSPPPAGPTSQDLADAKAAALTAKLQVPNGVLTLSWTDTFAGTSGYQIEQQNGATWTTLDTIPGQSGSRQPLTWSGPVTATGTYRIEALMSGYAVTLQTQSLNEQVLVTPPAAAPSIQLDQTEPVSGGVGLSLSTDGTYTSATYYVDLQSLASSTAPPDFAVSWDTGQLTAGSHLLLADLQSTADSVVEIRRTVQVTNPEVAVQLFIYDPPSASVDVIATSDFGITSVTASIDGTSLGTLTTPSRSNPDIYHFPIPASLSLSGQHDISVQAIDPNGASVTKHRTVTWNNAPSIALETPLDGALVNGTLHLAGTFSSDKPGTTVTVTAKLGAVTILTTQASPFSTDYSLSGVTPGNYTLTISAADGSGATSTTQAVTTVTSSSALVHAPVLRLGVFGSLLAADGVAILYQVADTSTHVRLHSAAADTLLTIPNNTSAQWRLDNGHAFALSTPAVNQDMHVYHWAPATATPQDLGALGPPDWAQLRAVHWPWVLGSSAVPSNSASGQDAQYTFYNASTGAKITPTLSDAALIAGNVDFFLAQNGLALFYPVDLGNNPGTNPVGISRWDQGSGHSTTITSAAVWSRNLQTDGALLGYQTGPAGQGTPPYTLVVRDLASGAEQSLSTTLINAPGTDGSSTSLGQFQVADGLVAWSEGNSNSNATKVFDGTTVTTLSTRASARLYGTSGGYVLYQDDARLYAWSSAGGKQLILDVPPGVAMIGGTTAYFTNGPQQALYAVPLN